MMLLLKSLLAWIVVLYTVVIIQGNLTICKRVVVWRWRKCLIVGRIKAGIIEGSRAP